MGSSSGRRENCACHVQRGAWTLIALAAFVAAAVVPVAAGTIGASNAEMGTLSLSATLSMQSVRGNFCPAGTAETVECHKRTGSGVVPGLGSVSQSYLYIIDTSPSNCVAGEGWILGMSARFTVAGKGELDCGSSPSGSVSLQRPAGRPPPEASPSSAAPAATPAPRGVAPSSTSRARR
jgi:hypothetical protein